MKYEKGSFITVPNQHILRGMPTQAQCLFMWLSFYSNQDGECFPSRSRLSKDCGFKKPQTVDKWIETLLSVGLIEKKNRFQKKEQLSNTYTVLILEEDYPPVPAKGLPSPRKGTTPQSPQRDTELNPSSLTKSKNIKVLSKIPGVVIGSEYESDGHSPLDEKKRLNSIARQLGLKKNSPKVDFIFQAGKDFQSGYVHFTGVEYVGNIYLQQFSKNLSAWYDRGETTESIRDMITAFFEGEKGKKTTATPTAVFSDHTYNSWKQKKL